MSTPTIDVSMNAQSYLPGASVVASWTVTDADNSTEVLTLQGTDSQGNTVSVDVTINRMDNFTMTRVFWPRTGTNLTVNNTNRTATGVMPSA